MVTQKRAFHGVFSRFGQTTGLVILGIVILVIIFLAVSLRERIWFGPVTPETLGERAEPLRDHILDCLKEIGDEHLLRIGLQGGYLRTPEGTYRKQQDIPVSYLCYNMEESPLCMNRALTLGQMEKELASAIEQDLLTCIDYSSFMKRGYDLQVGARELTVEIGRSATRVTMNQPLTLQKKEVVIREEEFVQMFQYPLGRLYDVSQDIVTAEATRGDFEQLTYMLAHQGEYVIEKKKPYPDTMYITTTKDSPYVFQFFIQGEPAS